MLNISEGDMTKQKLLVIFLTLSVFFCFSMFYRAFMAVISPDLAEGLHLNAEKLGILGAAFFYSFAVLQIPLGPLLDRIAPGIIVGGFSLIAGLGALLFSISESFMWALIGRILTGAGGACALVGALKVFTIVFSKHKFATVSGVFIAVGTVGSYLSTSPFAYLCAQIGWRRALFLFGTITIALALSVFWILRNLKAERNIDGSDPGCHRALDIFQRAKIIIGSLSFWQISGVAFCQYGIFIGLQGLWLGVYLIDVGGYSSVQVGHMLSVLAIGHALGSPCAGWLSDRIFRSKKSAVLWGLSLYCLSLLSLLWISAIYSITWCVIIFFSLGFFRSFGMLLYGHAKELYPGDLSGTAMTWVNFFLAVGSAFFIQLMGKVIELFPHVGQSYAPSGYRTSFLICFVAMAVSLTFYGFSKKDVAPLRYGVHAHSRLDGERIHNMEEL